MYTTTLFNKFFNISTTQICIKSHVVVVFVDYPLAPEVKFPVIHEESYTALTWILENGKALRADVSRLAVAGDSAGGNITASLSCMSEIKIYCPKLI